MSGAWAPAGAVYRALRLARAWRGSFPRAGAPFDGPMARYVAARARVVPANLVVALAAAVAAVTALTIHFV
ncbi:MAG TPA: hypothetical protein VGJ07_03200 [Rugosimonospora sp.]